MDIFKNDDILDNMEQDLLEEDIMQNSILKNQGFILNLERNKMVKNYDSEPVRSKSMYPIASHKRTLLPFDLIFNSLLSKSKLSYDRNPKEPNE